MINKQFVNKKMETPSSCLRFRWYWWFQNVSSVGIIVCEKMAEVRSIWYEIPSENTVYLTKCYEQVFKRAAGQLAVLPLEDIRSDLFSIPKTRSPPIIKQVHFRPAQRIHKSGRKCTDKKNWSFLTSRRRVKKLVRNVHCYKKGNIPAGNVTYCCRSGMIKWSDLLSISEKGDRLRTHRRKPSGLSHAENKMSNFRRGTARWHPIIPRRDALKNCNCAPALPGSRKGSK